MLRIIGGEWRGRRFRAPASDQVRPTTDRVRGGAAHATFVERDGAVAALISENLARLGGAGRAEVVRAAAEPYIAQHGIGPYDTVFADPPYRCTPGGELWRVLVQRLLVDGGRLVIEHAARTPVDLTGLDVSADVRRYGDSAVTLVTRPNPTQHAAQSPPREPE